MCEREVIKETDDLIFELTVSRRFKTINVGVINKKEDNRRIGNISWTIDGFCLFPFSQTSWTEKYLIEVAEVLASGKLEKYNRKLKQKLFN